jgi:hypothetical protein
MFNTDFYNARYFNKIIKDKDTLIKSSTNIDKIIAEYNYYYFLSPDKQRYFVQPFNLLIGDKMASYTMECINYKNLSQLFQSEYVAPSSFVKILNKIEDFKLNSYDNEKEKTLNNSRYLVLEKTKHRIKDFPEYQELFIRIEKAFNKYIQKRQTWNSVLSHGDLCFSNILWIKEIEMIKFIDPRGAINIEDMIIDEYYDLAKLSHSIFGKYESIIYDSNIEYTHIENIFLEYLKEKNICLELLKVYEASLFLSMIPIHSNNSNNIKMFSSMCDKILIEIGF